MFGESYLLGQNFPYPQVHNLTTDTMVSSKTLLTLLTIGYVTAAPANEQSAGLQLAKRETIPSNCLSPNATHECCALSVLKCWNHCTRHMSEFKLASVPLETRSLTPFLSTALKTQVKPDTDAGKSQYIIQDRVYFFLQHESTSIDIHKKALAVTDKTSCSPFNLSLSFTITYPWDVDTFSHFEAPWSPPSPPRTHPPKPRVSFLVASFFVSVKFSLEKAGFVLSVDPIGVFFNILSVKVYRSTLFIHVNVLISIGCLSCEQLILEQVSRFPSFLITIAWRLGNDRVCKVIPRHLADHRVCEVTPTNERSGI
ncbi:hypothetical protein NQZ79_g4439 [Umbelopsis isabellina]|nr:hypothetical protein NQZ79_g4439 [Umbelopsis isabellina]